MNQVMLNSCYFLQVIREYRKGVFWFRESVLQNYFRSSILSSTSYDVIYGPSQSKHPKDKQEICTVQNRLLTTNKLLVLGRLSVGRCYEAQKSFQLNCNMEKLALKGEETCFSAKVKCFV